LEASNGTVLWTADTGGTYPAASDGTMVFTWGAFFSANEKRLSALDAATGAVLWSLSVPYFSESPSLAQAPAIAGGVVYAISQADPSSSTDVVRALRAADGAVLWQTTFPRLTLSVSSKFAVANGLLYIGGRTGAIHVLDAATGAVLREVSATSSGTPGGPIVANGMVIFSVGTIYELGIPAG
ncbi:MAG TPA: PQQ-binding-like beta-propeller repeat protein, partial [Actinomycetota bacterium]|nr:PQQ-binding-like beta-propeller repeat protein [Actinomycetota bacterium]